MRIVVSLLIFIIIMPFSALAAIPAKPAYNSYVYDYANVLEDDREEQLIQAAKELEESTGNEVVMMTIDTIGGLQAYEFGTKVIREWGIGDKTSNNGMFIFATTAQGEGNNDVWISVGQGLEGDYPDGKIGRMIDTYMKPYLLEDDYTNAFTAIFNTLYSEMGGQATGEEVVATDDEGGVSIALIIFILILYLSLSKFGGGGPGGRRRTARRYYGTGGFGSGSSGGGFGGGGFGGFGGGGSAGGGAGRKF